MTLKVVVLWEQLRMFNNEQDEKRKKHFSLWPRFWNLPRQEEMYDTPKVAYCSVSTIIVEIMWHGCKVERMRGMVSLQLWSKFILGLSEVLKPNLLLLVYSGIITHILWKLGLIHPLHTVFVVQQVVWNSVLWSARDFSGYIVVPFDP